jgi:hypothetical protein
MKKIFGVVMVIGLASAAWAQGYSVGGGIMFGSDFGGGVEHKLTILGQSIKGSWPMPHTGGGAFAFFDMTYLEADVGFFFGSGKWELRVGSPFNTSFKVGDWSFTSFNIGVFAKYPFDVSGKVKLFPLLGAEYLAVVETRLDDEETSDRGDFSQLWFKAGGGIDYDINTSLYFRAEVLYGLRLATKLEKDGVEEMKTIWRSAFAPVSIQVTEGKTLLGHGLTVKLAVGFRL